MAVFAVTVGHGPGWDACRARREQAGWSEHAAFMDALVDRTITIDAIQPWTIWLDGRRRG